MRWTGVMFDVAGDLWLCLPSSLNMHWNCTYYGTLLYLCLSCWPALLFCGSSSVCGRIMLSVSLSSSHLSLSKVTTTGPRSLRRSPTWCSLTWWIRCCLMKTTVARSPGNAPPQSVRWTGRTARSPRRKMMMRGHRWSMDCLVSKCQSTECHVK